MKSLVSFATLAILAAVAPAINLYSTGFEDFADGNINGQFGYQVIENGSPFIVGPGGKTGKGVSRDTTPATNFGYAWAPLNHTPTVTNPIIVGSVDVSAGDLSAAGGTTTSSFGIGFYDPGGSAFGVARLQVAAGTSTQANFITLGGTVAVTATPGNWYNVRIELDTVANTATYYLDGVLINSSTYTISDAVIGDLDLTSSAAGWDKGTYDNLSVDAVPEPASMAVLGLGLAAFRKRRAKK